MTKPNIQPGQEMGKEVPVLHNSIPPSFGACLARIMAERGLTASQMAQQLAYKSKTTLFRVLQGQAGIRSVGNLCRDMLRCDALQLTEAEKEQLRIGYQVELRGLENYRAREEMWRLMRWEPEPDVLPLCLLQKNGTEITLEDFLAGFLPDGDTPADEISVMILNSCFPSVICALPPLLRHFRGQIQVEHVLLVNGDHTRTVRMIRNLLPILDFHYYEAFSVMQGELETSLGSTGGCGNVMVVRVQTADGGQREYQILLRDDTVGVLGEADGCFAQWQTYLQLYRTCRSPIKHQDPAVNDYVSLLESYAESERNREILIYKGDVCMDYIPTDILINACMDSEMEPGLADERETLLQTIDKLRSIQERRFHNTFTKRQDTHWVASVSALRQFARTGVQQDHFFAMRPFTVPERIRIFRHILDQFRENPYFHVYLLLPEDESTFLRLEAVFLSGLGVQLTPTDTDYCLADRYTQTLLTQDAFCHLFEQFFREELIANHTMGRPEAEEALRGILRDLEG